MTVNCKKLTSSSVWSLTFTDFYKKLIYKKKNKSLLFLLNLFYHLHLCDVVTPQFLFPLICQKQNLNISFPFALHHEHSNICFVQLQLFSKKEIRSSSWPSWLQLGTIMEKKTRINFFSLCFRNDSPLTTFYWFSLFSLSRLQQDALVLWRRHWTGESCNKFTVTTTPLSYHDSVYQGDSWFQWFGRSCPASGFSQFRTRSS